MNISQSKKVQPSQGWQWINQGARYFLAFKGQWLLTLIVLFSITLFLFALSPLFQYAMVIVFPLITAGLSMACFDIEKGQNMSVTYLLKAKDNPNRVNIFSYGLLVIVLLIFAQILSSLLLSLIGVSNAEVMQVITALKQEESIDFSLIFSSPILVKFILANLLFLLPIMAVNQIAPLVLTFSSLTGLDALKLSFQAVFKNASAFFVYAVSFLFFAFLIIFVLKALVALLLMVFGENSKIALLIYMGLFMVCIMSLMSLSYCSAYVAFKDLFTGEEP